MTMRPCPGAFRVVRCGVVWCNVVRFGVVWRAENACCPLPSATPSPTPARWGCAGLLLALFIRITDARATRAARAALTRRAAPR